MKRELLGAEGVNAADSCLRASRDFRISHTYFCIFFASLAAWSGARGNLLFEEGLVLQVLQKLSLERAECDSH